MSITIEKKASHRSSGSSDDKFQIGQQNNSPKEFAVNQKGFDPSLLFDPISGEWYAIRDATDRADFEAGTLIPLFGIAGATGAQGSTGVPGAQGETGVDGLGGIQGTTGSQGDTGLAIQGVTGADGAAGSQGDTGLAGSQGDTGLAGSAGSQGATGIQGLQGDQGDTGLAGSQGDTGLQGIQGDQGDTGVIGNQGTTGVGSPTTFVSAEITGTGSNQDTAHGLGVTPTKVLVSVTDNTGSSTFTVTEGAHDSTNVKVTLTSGVKYKVLAMP